MSIRSITPGTNVMGGEGVIHSPRSAVISARTPANGARTSVLDSSAWTRVTSARASSTPALAVAIAARAVLKALSKRSSRSGLTMSFLARRRFRSRAKHL